MGVDQFNCTPEGRQLQINAEIIEEFTNGGTIKNIATKNKLHPQKVYDIIKSYYPVKNGTEITIPSISTADKKQIINHFWNKKSLQEIGDILGVSATAIQNAALRMSLPAKKRISPKTIKWGNSKASIFLNMETGIYYFSRSEISFTIDKDENFLRRHLDQTPFVYLGRYSRKANRN